VKSILTDTGVVSNALATLDPTRPNLRPRARDIVVGPEFRYADPPLITLSQANIGVVDDVSAPPGAGAVLRDDPCPVLVELRRNGNAAQLAALAADGLQLGSHRGAQPEFAQCRDRRIE
jgi:hypothetical protein